MKYVECILPSPEINFRTDFALLFNARGYKEGIEIGVDQGGFACNLLERWHGDMLYLVDPYEPYPEMNWSRHNDMHTAIVALACKGFHGRYRLFPLTSKQMREEIHTQTWMISPDFVYIDGNHEYESVAEDIALWWNVLPPHGMLCGHDYDSTHPGVMRAVNEFADRERVNIYTVNGEHPRSWYAYKNEPEKYIVKFFMDGELNNNFYKKTKVNEPVK